ncbi:MAG: hypothetical protein K0R90_999, partial [Oscillospiraceae bacterium]|nr:hypothetical protein [Oscillospiraceae bacterium]
GYENKAQSLPHDAVAPMVTFICDCFMGGVDIV